MSKQTGRCSHVVGPNARPTIVASLQRIVAMITVLFGASLPAQAAPNASANANAAAERLPKLETWRAPAVKRGALAPTIVMRVLVGANGSVKQAKIVRPRPGLRQAEARALGAARSFHFQPGLKAGKPVDAWITLNLPLRPAPAGEHEIVVKGSDTIGETLAPAWAKALHRRDPKLSVRVEALGSSTGFAGLLDGSAEVATASRLIKPDEVEFADKLGVHLHEVFVGYDGITVIVHPDNPVRELDLPTLARIFSQQVTNWKELGGPDAPIHAIGRPSYSGTNALFKERVLSPLGTDAHFGPSVAKLEKNEDIVDAVGRDPKAIAYVGLAYVKPSVEVVALKENPGSAAVKPSDAAIYNISYPLARPLLLYMRTDASRDARRFVDFALSPEGQALVKRSGFVPMPGGSAGGFAAITPAPRVPAPELSRVYFDKNSASIDQTSMPDLMKAAQALRADRSILLIGNADSTGTLESNLKVARHRANTVAARLRQLAATPNPKIEIMVAATSHPLASNATVEGRHANRRVDVVVLRGSARSKPRKPMQPKPAQPTTVGARASAGVTAAAGL